MARLTMSDRRTLAKMYAEEKSVLEIATKLGCHPRYPGERGSNEKQNQMIRWFFPKGTDFRKVSARSIQKAIDWINNYPRRILDWHSSAELFDVFLAACA